MTPIFLYGTLRHAPLMRAVAGRDVTGQPAVLRDHVVRHAGAEIYPQIFAEPGAQATGILIEADAEVRAALDFYEGAYGYALRPVTVMTEAGDTPAQVYWPPQGTEAGALWDLAAWVRDWGAMSVSAAPDIQALRHSMTAEASRGIRPFALARGWARQMGHVPAPATLRRQPGPEDLRVRDLPGSYAGFFGLRRIELTQRRFNGEMAAPIQREVFMAFDAALVLPYDPVTDQVLLIEQLRFGPVVREDPNPWVLEPVAGLVDAGEDPAVAVMREAREEAGLTLDRVIALPGAYPTPGYTSEFFHLFIGIADLSGLSTGLGGLEDEDEDIRHHVIPRSRALELMDSGEINAVPLQALILWVERMRARGDFD